MKYFQNRTIIIAFGIFLAAFLLRFGYFLFLKDNYLFFDQPGSDVLYYQDWAYRILQGQWIGTHVFFGLPLYPYFLAAVYSITFGNLFLANILQLGLGSLNCVLIFIITKKIFDHKTALIAAILSCTNFSLIYYDWLTMPVTLIITLTLVMILGFYEVYAKPHPRKWGLLGLLIGITALGDGKFLILVMLLLVYLALVDRKNFPQISLKVLLPLFIGTGIILTLIAARNRMVGGEWILITAQTGLSFYVGNHAQATGLFENPEFIRPTHAGQDQDQQIAAQHIAQKSLTPKEVSQFWRRRALRDIRYSPLRYLQLLKTKLVLFFTEHELAYDIDLLLQRPWKEKFDFNSFYVLCPLAILGLLLTWRHPRTPILNLLALSQLLFTVIFFLTHRHRASILPVFLIYQAYALTWLLEQTGQRRFRHLLCSLIFLGIFWMTVKPIRVDAQTQRFLLATKSGAVFERRNQTEKAEEEYHKALQLRPNDSNTLYNLANLYLKRNEPRVAIHYYQKTLELVPYQPDALYNLAYAFEQINSLDLALETYQRLLTVTPKAVDAHYRLANIYYQQKNFQQALFHYQEILMENPQLQSKILPLIEKCQTNIRIPPQIKKSVNDE